MTEIGYHKKATIEADVEFLSVGEWRSELQILVEDLVDQEGNTKNVKSLQKDAAVAWSKVNAVYPMILVGAPFRKRQFRVLIVFSAGASREYVGRPDNGGRPPYVFCLLRACNR